jgi:hypothetical protein
LDLRIIPRRGKGGPDGEFFGHIMRMRIEGAEMFTLAVALTCSGERIWGAVRFFFRWSKTDFWGTLVQVEAMQCHSHNVSLIGRQLEPFERLLYISFSLPFQ